MTANKDVATLDDGSITVIDWGDNRHAVYVHARFLPMLPERFAWEESGSYEGFVFVELGNPDDAWALSEELQALLLLPFEKSLSRW